MKKRYYTYLTILVSFLFVGQKLLAQEGKPIIKFDKANSFYVEIDTSPADMFTNLWKQILPTDFTDIVFTSTGKTTMDEIYFFCRYKDIMPDLPEATEEALMQIGVCGYALEDKSGYEVSMLIPTELTNIPFANLKDKRLYFTGSCINAIAGNPDDPATASFPGVFVLQGGAGEKVDIYLHDFSITVQDKQVGSAQFNDLFSAYDSGCMASAFAIESDNEDTTQPFTANFHICGENTITGGNRSIFTAPEDNNFAQVLANILTITNSPIAICPLAKTLDEVSNKTAKLVFDDIVPVRGVSTRVNGKLNLPLEGSYSTPAIDLGNANGFCEFNGGQYRFATPASNSMFYVCSMAISYKMLTISGTTRYGIGSSVGSPTTNVNENKVRITFNDGTFSTYSAEAYKTDNIDVVARGWYADYTDLRLSYESRINGGTFSNCRVYRCDASAERGASPVNSNHESLCYKELVVPAPAGAYGTMSAEQVAADSYLSAAANYGSQSLTPVKENEQYKLNVYLPLADCDEDVSSKEYIHNWVTIIPKMGANGLLTMGGDVEVSALETDGHTMRKNAYLFYARLNDYTKENAKVNIGLPVPVFAAIANGGGPEFSSVTNNAAYTIAHGLYTMLSFETNRWYSLSMPYDVANIYVIETTGTQKGKHPTIGPSETSLQFLQRQGQADGNLASTIITSLCPDILSGKGSGVAMNLMDIIDKQLPDSATVYPLVAYNPALEGHGSKDAHYYLYEQVPDGKNQGAPYWEFSEDVNEYSKKWQCVTPTPFVKGTYTNQNGIPVDAGTIQMQKGKVYSLFLPDSESSRYWDGKYLIFEGYGPQIIDGVETHDEQYFLPDYVDAWDDIVNWDVPEDMGTGSEKCIMQGNSTFANFVIPDEQPVFMYDVVDNNPIYRKVDNSTLSDATKKALLPCDVMMVLNNANTARFETITRNGNTAKTQSSEAPQVITDNDLPKVGDISLVAMAQNGITLRSYAAQQVNIYTLDGRLLYSDTLSDGSVVRVPAVSGVYLVQGQEQTYKLIVP